MSGREWVEPAPGFHCRADVLPSLQRLGLTTLEAVFAFEGGEALDKDNLAPWRRRTRLVLPDRGQTAYLKRYDRPPWLVQIRAWIAHGRRASLAQFDHEPAEALARAGIGTPETLAHGTCWAGPFERRSFILAAAIPDAESLERRLPACFDDLSPTAHVAQRRAFIEALARFVRRFHDTGWRHRDLYLSHIFHAKDGRFFLIDLHRAFRPRLRPLRWRLKDLAQLHYSAPGPIFSCADRLRFYRCYMGIKRLRRIDRRLLHRIRRRAWRMADHDLRHGRSAPFAM